ncbi:MAG: helix-turn-helix domain-containing protein [Candidatus Obscuribacterales bacterium]|nr:helix-turn-helix domain-containing protein [Candidatus Obscuribacterales bacterium]
MKIKNAHEFGQLIREARQAQNLRQVDLAAASGCGERFIIDLEKGKPTCELEKAFSVAQMLGISLEAKSPSKRGES